MANNSNNRGNNQSAFSHSNDINDENMSTKKFENDLQKKDDEILKLKTHVAELEQELVDVRKFQESQIHELKLKTESIINRAKNMLLENTQVIKNRELQVEALNQQISSIKDVSTITKTLLEVKNLEAEELESKIKIMEDKYKRGERCYELLQKRLDVMIGINADWKNKYEALCKKYNEEISGKCSSKTIVLETTVAADENVNAQLEDESH